ncbi:MAG: magnesium transporter CorA family protein [Oscillospiraceae bacterium]|jgi:magnesium transporter|nr:magnesium transporter CorA family protein [Oscillospiraceae bacterium]
MISYYKTINGKITCIDKYECNCWINCIAPTNKEVGYLIKEFKIDPDFLRASLDEEESSHIDSDHENTLVIIDVPICTNENDNISYSTIPLGVMLTKCNVITVCLRENPILEELSRGVVKGVYLNLKTHFVFHIMLRMATKYLLYLKHIDKISHHVEKELRKSMKNKDLILLLEVEKSLVYFSASLKANEGTLAKIRRGRVLKLYEEDQDLLEDVMIEIKQAIEMSSIYLNILSGTMDAFASIISNNLNIVMKVLASITLIMSIPTIIFSFYGMNINVDKLPFDQIWWCPVAISGIMMGVTYMILKKKNML